MPPNYRLVLLQLMRHPILPSYPNQGVKINEDSSLRVEVFKPL